MFLNQRSSLFDIWGNVFLLSDLAPLNRGVAPSNCFCFANKLESFCEGTLQFVAIAIVHKELNGWLFVVLVCACTVYVSVCVTELRRERISRNLSSAMLMLAWRQTRRLTEELIIIIILEKWSKVSFYSRPTKARLFITLGRCLVASLVCLLWALKLI